MQVIIERHTYAPELNKAHFIKHGQRVGTMPAPGCRDVKSFRAAVQPKPVEGKHYSIRQITGGFCGIPDRVINGMGTPAAVVEMRRHLRARNAAGAVLINGQTMPEFPIIVKLLAVI